MLFFLMYTEILRSEMVHKLEYALKYPSKRKRAGDRFKSMPKCWLIKSEGQCLTVFSFQNKKTKQSKNNKKCTTTFAKATK